MATAAAQYEKISDTLDVWFDSGATHWHVLRGSHADLARTDGGPVADLYLEGSDQHRGWFHSSLLTGCAIDGQAPYKALLTHGFTVDAQGRKMSKSLGNGIEPQEVGNKLGIEILRLWLASTDYSGELSISKEILDRVVETYRRLRNTVRFLLANIADFDAQADMLPADQWLTIDRYALALTRDLQARVTADYEQYEFHRVVQALQHFASEDLGAFYLDVLKDRLYTTAPGSHARRSAQSALWHITHTLVRLMAPVLAFTAEEIWTVLGDTSADSVMLTTWHALPEQADEAALMDAAIEAGADDVLSNDDGSIEVITPPNDFMAVKEAMEAAGLKAVMAEVTMKAMSEVEFTGDDAVKMQKILDALEDLDDVQDVYTTALIEE